MIKWLIWILICTLSFGSINFNQQYLEATKSITGGDAITFVLEMQNDTQLEEWAFCWGLDSGAASAILIGINTSTTVGGTLPGYISMNTRNSVGQLTYTKQSNYIQADGQAHRIVMTSDAARSVGDKIRMFMDGVQITGLTVENQDGTTSRTGDRIWVGTNADHTAAYMSQNSIQAVAYIESALSDDAAKDLSYRGTPINAVSAYNPLIFYVLDGGNTDKLVDVVRNASIFGSSYDLFPVGASVWGNNK